MRDVILPKPLLEEMKSHARESYPDECCGFLLSSSPEREASEDRRIEEVERARNEFNGERRRRFMIRPEELREVERRGERTGRAVVGFYHSHPDHPPRPSQFDLEHAWPWYTYLVLAVTARDFPGVGAFELDPDRPVFQEVRLHAADSPFSHRSMTQG